MLLLFRARLSAVLICATMIAVVGTALMPIMVSATGEKTATWVNMATLNFDGANYKEDDAGDANWHFYGKNPTNGCSQEIDSLNYNASDGPYTEKTAKVHKQKSVPGGCSSDGTETIRVLDKPSGFNVAFVWNDNSNIVSADGKRKFSGPDKDGSFLSIIDGNCKDFITAGSDKTKITLVIRSNQGYGSEDATNSLKKKYGNGEVDSSGYPFHSSIKSQGDVSVNGESCHQSKPIENISADATKAVTPGTSTISGSGSTSTAPDNSCESKGGALAWITCSSLRLVDSALSFLDEQIRGLLDVDTNFNGHIDAVQAAWANIRNLAYIILIPIMLVMVVGTALGFEIVSAYTIKRALPRLVLAVIFISLSFVICTFLIDVSNNIGKGTLGFLTLPFVDASRSVETQSAAKLTLASFYTPSSGAAGALEGIIGAFASIALIAGLVILLWIFGASLFLFTAIGFLTLMFRQMLIILLIMIAPLAILAWIFPNNDKLWKAWWSLFSKLLIMYPLIMALIASGRIFAWILF